MIRNFFVLPKSKRRLTLATELLPTPGKKTHKLDKNPKTEQHASLLVNSNSSSSSFAFYILFDLTICTNMVRATLNPSEQNVELFWVKKWAIPLYESDEPFCVHYTADLSREKSTLLSSLPWEMQFVVELPEPMFRTQKHIELSKWLTKTCCKLQIWRATKI